MSLRRFRDIQGWELGAVDGEIGRCHDVLFDDTDWTIRYIVADTGKWLPGRKVLISPLAIRTFEESTGILDLSLTKDQIKNAPPLDSDAPVSRRYEIAFNWHYDWPNYWSGPSIRDPHLYPTLLNRPEERDQRSDLQDQFLDKLPEEQTHLRSAQEVLEYRTVTGDTDLGNIEDILVDEESWTVRFLLVDARKLLPEVKWLLIPHHWVGKIEWAKSSIAVELTIDQLKKSPRFDPAMEVDQEYEKILHDHYGMPSWQEQRERS